MANNYIYAKRKLSEAIHLLVTGEGDVRSRLLSVHRRIYVLSESDFPNDLISEWNQIISDLTEFGTVPETLDRIRNRKGGKIAEKIYYLKIKIDMLNSK